MKKLGTVLLSTAIAAGMGFGASLLPEQAQAGWAPKKPVEFVIMAGKGGGADRLARFIQGIIEKNKLSAKPFVPMLELKEVSEPEVPSEIEFNLKLQHSKKIRQAEQEFNQHIQTMVQPKLAMFDPGLYVRIELEIGVSGKINRYKILESSPSNAFNQAAQLAVRNVNLNPLPEALAENPPYIVVVKVIPQLQ